MKSSLLALVLAASSAALCACGSQADTYREAFSRQQALSNNSRTLSASRETVWRGVNQTLIGQGFTIRQVNDTSGLITAEREMSDPGDAELSYDVTATANVAEAGKDRTEVELSANQKTIRHQKYHTWWHLLWLVPLFPTGTEYNTVVRRESTVTDSGFYSDFFAALDNHVKAAPAEEAAAQPAPSIASNDAPPHPDPLSAAGASAAETAPAPVLSDQPAPPPSPDAGHQ